MQVKVIGSGSMWNAYNSASYLIDNKIIVDFPNGMCKNLFRMGINPREINDVVITHFHGDHYFDIPFFFLLKSKSDNKKLNIYCGKEGKKKNSKLLKLAFPNPAKEILNALNLTYNHSDNFKINEYSVKRYQVDHGRMKPSYGYIFSKDNINIGFTGDATLCESVEYMAETCDYLFCDCMLIEGTSKHMGVDMLKKLLKKGSDCKFVVSHLDDETRKKITKLKIKNVIIPEDGDVIKIVK